MTYFNTLKSFYASLKKVISKSKLITFCEEEPKILNIVKFTDNKLHFTHKKPKLIVIECFM